MATATILGRQVKRVLVGGAACLAIALGPVEVDGKQGVLVWTESRWTTATVDPVTILGCASPSDRRLPAARLAAVHLF